MKVKQLFEDSNEVLKKQLEDIKRKLPNVKDQMGKNVLYNKMNAIKRQIEKQFNNEKEKIASQELKKKDPEGYKNLMTQKTKLHESDFENELDASRHKSHGHDEIAGKEPDEKDIAGRIKYHKKLADYHFDHMEDEGTGGTYHNNQFRRQNVIIKELKAKQEK